MPLLDVLALLGLFLLVCIALPCTLAIGPIEILHRLGLYDLLTLQARLDLLRIDIAVAARDSSPQEPAPARPHDSGLTLAKPDGRPQKEA